MARVQGLIPLRALEHVNRQSIIRIRTIDLSRKNIAELDA